MKPSKEPLRVRETIVLPERTVCWVTMETGRSEGNLVLPTGTGKGMLLHIENGKVEIPMLNDKDEDQQLIKGSLFAHAELLSGDQGLGRLLVRLKQVLDARRAAGLTLKISKCVFGSDELDYLGFKIVKGYLRPEDQVLIIQRSDAVLTNLTRILEKPIKERNKEESVKVKNLRLKDGKLFYVEGDGRLLFAMPKSMRETLCVKFHDLKGHFGTDRTVTKIKALCWFPRMKRYVDQHIRMCFQRLITKVPGGRSLDFFTPIPPGKRQFQVIHMDHVGPFVRCSK
ncbi:hypothetical protein MTO96_030859 [Rhipicephalus appendiculatus]